MASGYGKAHENNTIGYGKASINNSIGFGIIYKNMTAATGKTLLEPTTQNNNG